MYKLTVLSLLASAAPFLSGGAITNGGLESNGGAGTSIFTGWTVDTEAGGGGSWYVQTGTSSPISGFTVPLPTEGSFAAMTDSTGPGTQVLIQTFTVAPGVSSVTLSFDYYLNNLAQDFFPNSDIDYTDGYPNQQARVDILSAGAGDFDSAVLLNVFQTQSGDPLQPGVYQTLTMDITSTVAAGGTFELRFAEVDNQQTLNFGVDNVVVEINAPEPATWGFISAGLLAILALRHRRHS
jgi:hypothetical protein